MCAGKGLNRFMGDASREQNAASSCFKTVLQRDPKEPGQIRVNRWFDQKRIVGGGSFFFRFSFFSPLDKIESSLLERSMTR